MPAANLSDTEQQTLRDATKILKKMWEQGESSRKEIYDYKPNPRRTHATSDIPPERAI